MQLSLLQVLDQKAGQSKAEPSLDAASRDQVTAITGTQGTEFSEIFAGEFASDEITETSKEASFDTSPVSGKVRETIELGGSSNKDEDAGRALESPGEGVLERSNHAFPIGFTVSLVNELPNRSLVRSMQHQWPQQAKQYPPAVQPISSEPNTSLAFTPQDKPFQIGATDQTPPPPKQAAAKHNTTDAKVLPVEPKVNIEQRVLKSPHDNRFILDLGEPKAKNQIIKTNLESSIKTPGFVFSQSTGFSIPNTPETQLAKQEPKVAKFAHNAMTPALKENEIAQPQYNREVIDDAKVLNPFAEVPTKELTSVATAIRSEFKATPVPHPHSDKNIVGNGNRILGTKAEEEILPLRQSYPTLGHSLKELDQSELNSAVAQKSPNVTGVSVFGERNDPISQSLKVEGIEKAATPAIAPEFGTPSRAAPSLRDGTHSKLTVSKVASHSIAHNPTVRTDLVSVTSEPIEQDRSVLKLAAARPIAEPDKETVIQQVINLKGSGPITPIDPTVSLGNTPVSHLTTPLRTDQLPAFTPPQSQVSKTPLRNQPSPPNSNDPKLLAPARSRPPSEVSKLVKSPISGSGINVVELSVSVSQPMKMPRKQDRPSNSTNRHNETFQEVPKTPPTLSPVQEGKSLAVTQKTLIQQASASPVFSPVQSIYFKSPNHGNTHSRDFPMPTSPHSEQIVPGSILHESPPRNPFKDDQTLRYPANPAAIEQPHIGSSNVASVPPIGNSVATGKAAPVSSVAVPKEDSQTSGLLLQAELTNPSRIEGTPVNSSTAQNSTYRMDLPSHVARQIVEIAQYVPNKPVEISLNPEELGRLRLSVSATDAGLVVNVVAERPETLDLLRRHISTLGQEFQSLGYEDVSFSFNDGKKPDSQGEASEEPSPEFPLVGVTKASGRPNEPSILQSSAHAGIDLRL